MSAPPVPHTGASSVDTLMDGLYEAFRRCTIEQRGCPICGSTLTAEQSAAIAPPPLGQGATP